MPGLPGGAPAGAASDKATEEVGRVALLPPVGTDSAPSGWLVVSPKSRRGYQIFETAGSPASTTIQSFDLDSFAPRKRFEVQGMPLLGGQGGGNVVGAGSLGEVVHAVDDEAGRVYIAMAEGIGIAPRQFVASSGASADVARPLNRILAIDEARLDAGHPESVASIGPPALHLRTFEDFWLQGIAVSRHPATTGRFARLVLAFAQPATSQGPAPAHTVLQWDVANVRLRSLADVRANATPATADTAAADWSQVLGDKCARASMTATTTHLDGSYQWGILPAPDGVYLACQASLGSAQTVRVELDRNTGTPTGVVAVDLLSRLVADVLVDPMARRLLYKVNTNGYGSSWWVYDANIRRYTGAISGVASDGWLGAYGLNPRTGRFYALIQDYAVNLVGGRRIPVRGGLHVSDMRIDPPPALSNVAPELAYPATRRIAVDWLRNRVLLRLGTPSQVRRAVYPGLEPTTPAPFESFYRVLEDHTPPAVSQPEQDDSAFTTNVTEQEGLTSASYLVGGASYGSRAVLTGGPRAAAAAHGDLDDLLFNPDTGFLRPYRPPCADENDRELVAGEVASASVSDVGAKAVARGLFADAVTKSDMAQPANRCWPSPSNVAVPKPPAERRWTFDGDDPDEVDDFATECSDDDNPAKAERDGYSADVRCNRKGTEVQAKATGALVTPAFVAGDAGRPLAPVADAPQVKVGYSHSELTLSRNPDGGVIAKADAIARNIVIGDTLRIGVVRTEASAFAAGQRGTASTTFTRTVCGVELQGSPVAAGCLTEDGMRQLEENVRQRFGGQMEIRFKPTDPMLYDGSPSGYQAAIQRDRLDRFGDQIINRDTSLAVPGLEVMFFRGDSAKNGPGRQLFQFAGVQVNASYGIVCLYGEAKKGGCHTEPSSDLDPDDDLDDDEGGIDGAFAAAGEPGGGGISGERAASVRGGRGGRSIIDRIMGLPADVAQLLFSNPREFGLLAAVWALLYAPCYLGERRRSLRRLATSRIPVGGVA